MLIDYNNRRLLFLKHWANYVLGISGILCVILSYAKGTTSTGTESNILKQDSRPPHIQKNSVKHAVQWPKNAAAKKLNATTSIHHPGKTGDSYYTNLLDKAQELKRLEYQRELLKLKNEISALQLSLTEKLKKTQKLTELRKQPSKQHATVPSKPLQPYITDLHLSALLLQEKNPAAELDVAGETFLLHQGDKLPGTHYQISTINSRGVILWDGHHIKSLPLENKR